MRSARTSGAGLGVDQGAQMTDDTIELNERLSHGGLVHISAGEYLIDAALNVGSDTTVVGDGAATIIRRADGADCHVFRIEGHDIDISRLVVDGNNPAGKQGAGHGIVLAGSVCGRVTVHDLTVYRCARDGIAFAAERSRDCDVTGCIVFGCEGAGITVRSGVSIDGAFSDNRVWATNEMNVGVTSVAHGFAIRGNRCNYTQIADNITCYGDVSSGVTITGNICRDSGRNGIHFGGDDSVISGNIVSGAAKYGIQLRQQGSDISHGLNCTGNSITTAGKSGIWAEDCEGSSITSNVVRDCAEHGIWLKTVKHSTIADNTITGCMQDRVYETMGCEDNHISGDWV